MAKREAETEAVRRRNERARAEGFKNYYEKRTVLGVAAGKTVAAARGHPRGEYRRGIIRHLHPTVRTRLGAARVEQWETGDPTISDVKSRKNAVDAATLRRMIAQHVKARGVARIAIYGVFDYRAMAPVVRWAAFAQTRAEALDELDQIIAATQQFLITEEIVAQSKLIGPLTPRQMQGLRVRAYNEENRLLSEWVSSHLNVIGEDDNGNPVSATPCYRVFAASVAPSFVYERVPGEGESA